MFNRSTLGFAATALVSGVTGWLLHAPSPIAAVSPDRPQPISSAAKPATPAAQSGTESMIVVSSDGNVTLRVEQQPLEWVLEQLAQQSGWRDIKERARATAVAEGASATPAEACVEPPMPKPETDRLLQTIQRGSESDRVQGLLQARNESVQLPDDVLKVLYETDSSEGVRLLAFEAYLEPRAGDDKAMRSSLEAALYVPDAAIQREAKRRLDELAESARIDAESVQKPGP